MTLRYFLSLNSHKENRLLLLDGETAFMIVHALGCYSKMFYRGVGYCLGIKWCIEAKSRLKSLTLKGTLELVLVLVRNVFEWLNCN